MSLFGTAWTNQVASGDQVSCPWRVRCAARRKRAPESATADSCTSPRNCLVRNGDGFTTQSKTYLGKTVMLVARHSARCPCGDARAS
jgi:hypothetical protein